MPGDQLQSKRIFSTIKREIARHAECQQTSAAAISSVTSQSVSSHSATMLANLALLFLAIAGATTAAPYEPKSSKKLPPCTIEDRRCRCPPGSTFKNFTSFGIIGTPAIEVQKIMGPCTIDPTLRTATHIHTLTATSLEH